MQISYEIDSLYQQIHISSHITKTSYIQYLIAFENFKFANFNPLLQIFAEIEFFLGLNLKG